MTYFYNLFTGTFLKTQLKKRNEEGPKIISPEEAWAIIIDRNYSYRDYANLRRDVNQAAKANIYPCKLLNIKILFTVIKI